MDRQQMLTGLDREISRLQQVRDLLTASAADRRAVKTTQAKRRPGRPAGSGELSAEGRHRIAEGMRRSWALRKQSAP